MKITLDVPTCSHITPTYHGYKQGTFSKLTFCTDCGRIGLYEDQHPATVCTVCGGKISKECKAGRWNRSRKLWEVRQ